MRLWLVGSLVHAQQSMLVGIPVDQLLQLTLLLLGMGSYCASLHNKEFRYLDVSRAQFVLQLKTMYGSRVLFI